jgi:hypothetical protein
VDGVWVSGWVGKGGGGAQGCLGCVCGRGGGVYRGQKETCDRLYDSYNWVTSWGRCVQSVSSTAIIDVEHHTVCFNCSTC